ncbi:hypothetical protein C7271_06465 [filamentous cyanobacterium CCP5]|nr:hypothetical protein C7271_06465 [filamentous cyanobacterium CCP5]
MIISDLSYLENIAEEEVVGAGSFSAFKNVAITVDIFESIQVQKDVQSNVTISGNLATAESGADAFGNNTLAESFAFTYTDEGSSSSNAFSLSATL